MSGVPTKRRHDEHLLPDESFHWHKRDAGARRTVLQSPHAPRRAPPRERRASRPPENAADVWRDRENEFVLEQSRRRASIRAAQGRARPIDLLVLTLLWARGASDDDPAALEVDLPPPEELVGDPETLADVRMFLECESDSESRAFWHEVLAASEHEPTRVNESVAADIDGMFAQKTPEELAALEASIQAKVHSGEPLDVEYWAAVLRRLAVWKSRAQLRRVHSAALAHRTARVRAAQRADGARMCEELADVECSAFPAGSAWTADMEPATTYTEATLPRENRLAVVHASDFRRAVSEARRRVVDAGFVPRQAAREPARSAAAGTPADEMYRREAERPLQVEEEAFDGAVSVGGTYQWSERYRPRKPRYVNRVNTGYEWNRYNQTHYDQDNPPPRVVQGYRFNIFYPDLLDPGRAPTYKLIREPPESGCGDTVVLRFSAGPPYEDVAFRIVDRPWEHSQRRGFRCVFERGVLQLYFNFKRLRYRK